MAIITPPATFPLGPGCTWGERRTDAVDASDPSGAEQAHVYGPPRWTQELVSPETLSADAAADWQTMRLRLRGQINRLAMHNPARPVPRGTMRGTMVLASALAAGLDTVTISASGQAGHTLLAGDYLQLGAGLGTSQLIRVAAPATANGSGVITITFDHVARLAFAAGAAVTWERPLCYWVQESTETTWGYVNRRGSQQSIALVEAFK
jgi:hypothetical protein